MQFQAFEIYIRHKKIDARVAISKMQLSTYQIMLV